MDPLDRLLELAQVRGVVDVRCYLAGSFDIDHDAVPSGEAPFHLVMTGGGQVVLPDGSSIEIRAGDLLVLVRGSRHRVQSSSGKEAARPVTFDASGPIPVKRNTEDAAELDLLCGRFVFAPDSVALLFDALPDVLHVRLSNHHALSSLSGLVEIMRNEVARMDPGVYAVVSALAQTLLVFALRSAMHAGLVSRSLLTLLSEPRLGKAVFAVLHDPAREWTVSLMAEQAMMSRATFARHFEAAAGTSPLELVTRLRMELARELLRKGSLPVGAVGERVGYRSEAAFSRVFSKLTGATPARYRRDIRNGDAVCITPCNVTQ